MLTDPQFLDATSDLQRLAILQAAEEQGTYVSPLTADCFKDATEDIQRLEILRAIQGITGGGGGGSNAIYYFNRSNPSSIAGYYEVSRNLVIGAGTTLTATGAGTQLVGSFATVSSDPNVTTIPAGNWNFENYVSMSSNGGTPKIYGEIYVRNLAGTETLIGTNISNPHPITEGTLNELYLWGIPVPTTVVLATDRIVVKFYALDLTGRTMTMHFEDANVAQVTTSLSSAAIMTPVYQSTYYKSVDQNLINGSTDITFDVNATWNNGGGYITHTSGSTDFTVVQAGLYQLEWNASINANGATWNNSLNKTISINITRSPELEQLVIGQSAIMAISQNYSQSICSTIKLEVNDVINLQTFLAFATTTPFVQGIQNTYDLNTWFSWRFIS